METRKYKEKKCLSNARRPTGSPGSEMTAHKNFVFELVLIFILNLAMQKNKQTNKQKTLFNFCSLGITLRRSNILFFNNAHISAVSDVHTGHHGLLVTSGQLSLLWQFQSVIEC